MDGIYMDAVVAMTGSGGWPLTVFLTPEGEPFLGGTYFPPAPRHGLPAFPQVLVAVSELYRERRAEVTQRTRRAGRRAASRPPAAAPSAEPLTESLLVRGGAAARRAARPGVGRVRRARRSSRRPRRWSCCCGAGRPSWRRAQTLDGDGRRRDVRPRRRRLPPLLGGRALARAALREDALRQRAARARVPARLARDRPGALPRGGRGDGRVPAPRPAAAGRRLRLLAGRGHRRRRGADVHLGAGRGRAGGAVRAVRGRPLRAARHARPATRGAAARAPRAAARSPGSTTRRSPPGTGSRWRRWPRRGGGSSAPTGSTRRGALGRVPARAALGRRGRLVPQPARRARRAAPASSTTTPTSRTGSTSCTSRPASCAGSRRRGDWRCSRSSSSRTRSDGGFFLAPADGEQLVARRKELYDHPVPSGNSMLAYVLLRLARIYGDDELERARRRRAAAPRRRASAAARPSSPGR